MFNGNLTETNDYFTFSVSLVNLRCLAQLINLTSKNQVDIMSMHVHNQPLQAKATVEINIVATQRVAARLQNQYRKQMEVIHVRTCVGSSGQTLVANEELF